MPSMRELPLSMLSLGSRRLSEIAKSDRYFIRFNTYQTQGFMGNVGGKRNYGYGKQLAWAGKNALADRYGQGHFGTPRYP